jgi:hypothetical protein
MVLKVSITIKQILSLTFFFFIYNQCQICLGTFPHVFLELADTEVTDYFKPSDLMIGKTVNIYGRNFLIYDCDMFTKTFYAKNFGVNNFEPINIQAPRNDFSKMVKLKNL